MKDLTCTEKITTKEIIQSNDLNGLTDPQKTFSLKYLNAAELLECFLHLESTLKEVDIYDDNFKNLPLNDRIAALHMFEANSKIHVRYKHTKNGDFGYYLRQNLIEEFENYERNIELSNFNSKGPIHKCKKLDVLHKSLLERSAKYAEKTPLEAKRIISLSQKLGDLGLEYSINLYRVRNQIIKLQSKNNYIVYFTLATFCSGLLMLKPSGGQSNFLDPIYFLSMLTCIVMLFIATIFLSLLSRMPVIINYVTMACFVGLIFPKLANDSTFFTANNLNAIALIILSFTNLRYLLKSFYLNKHIANIKNTVVKLVSLG